MNEKTKTETTRLGLVLLLLLMLTFIAFFSIRVKKEISQKHTVEMLETVLELALGNTFKVDTKLNINSSLSETMHFYRVKHKNKNAIASLVRITGFSGPQTCLFLYDEESHEQSFITIVPLLQDDEYILADNYFDYGITDSILNYWIQKTQRVLHEGAAQ